MKIKLFIIFILLFSLSTFSYQIPLEAIKSHVEAGKPIEIPFINATKVKEIPETCKNLCGDGICQEIVCMAIGCPCPETKESCPQDCGNYNETFEKVPVISLPTETSIKINPAEVLAININEKPVNFTGIKEIPIISMKVKELNKSKEVDVNIEINKEQKIINISVGDTVAITHEIIKFENKTLKIETPGTSISINILPHSAKEIVISKENQEIKNMELVRVQTRASYEIHGEKEVKILGIIPAKMEIKTSLNAENGNIEKIEKPWWSFLAI
ncbi:MAG: hypothetical protein QXF15_02065 [Candidatus Aenigmatarchaeota archaeon]|nr:hypothetical protein [Candidatus Aenigmarchaeota archaeon]